jgi:hypothetical protein
MRNKLLRTMLPVAFCLASTTASVAQVQTGDAYVDAMLRDTAALLAQSQRQMQEMRKSANLPPLTGNGTQDQMTLLREQQQAFYKHLENVKRCGSGDAAACESARRYEAAQRRAMGLMNAVNADAKIRNSVTRNQYERQWNDEYQRAKYNEWYYDKMQKNDDLKEYWKKQAETYKPKK